MPDTTPPVTSKREKCGIVMPISSIEGLPERHWEEVKEILLEAIEAAGFEGNLVSNADDVGIIQKRIIENLYENPVVVCDVSAKNPNVMFELGMRLAFDKPTIIVKDDKTSYTFDTSPIEHLEYPRDLRFGKIVDFKIKLTEKIQRTHDKAKNDSNYTTFLKHFGEFKVAKIDQKEVPAQEFIMEELASIRQSVSRLERPLRLKSEDRPRRPFQLSVDHLPKDRVNEIARFIVSEYPDLFVRVVEDNDDHYMTVDGGNRTAREMREIDSRICTTFPDLNPAVDQRTLLSDSSVRW